MRVAFVSSLLALAVVAGCGSATFPAPVPVLGHPEIFYLPEERLRGRLVVGFEVFTFDDCWLEMTRDAATQFSRLAPEADGRGPHFFRVTMIARRTPPGLGHRFGHLGAYACQVQAIRFLELSPAR